MQQSSLKYELQSPIFNLKLKKKQISARSSVSLGLILSKKAQLGTFILVPTFSGQEIVP